MGNQDFFDELGFGLKLLLGPMRFLKSNFQRSLLSRSRSGRYDPCRAFREDLATNKSHHPWTASEIVYRAITLAEEETGVFPQPGNAAAQALTAYAIIGQKWAQGDSLTPEEERVVQRLTGTDRDSIAIYVDRGEQE